MNEQDAAYDAACAPHKRALLEPLATCGEAGGRATVLELGIGGFGHAALYPCATSVVGIEPDTRRHAAAQAAALESGLSLRLMACPAEALPLADNSVDAVVSVCTLCSVQDPRRAMQEAHRVLRPGGRLLFWEHVRCETQPALAARQVAASDNEEALWGCRFDRRSLEVVRDAGFAQMHGCYFELPGLDLMSPTTLGSAIK